MSLIVRQYFNTPITSCCYLIVDRKTKRSIIVDPGTSDMNFLVKFINKYGADYIILTHEHFDHILGCNWLWKGYKIPILCSNYTSRAILDIRQNYSFFYGLPCRVLNRVYIVDSTSNFYWNGRKISIYESPGHSNGSIIFTIGHYVFTGDTLMKGVVTYTKFKTGSKDKLKKTYDFIRYNLVGKGYMVCP